MTDTQPISSEQAAREQELIETVVASFDGAPDERLGELRARLDAVTDEGERAMIASAMADEEAKKAAAAQRKEEWRVENLRRKHDFVPFLLKTMEIMAEKGVLSSAVDKAQAQAEEMMKKEQQQQ